MLGAAPGPPIGQVSPDGAWYWDGRAWQPAVSADGYWRWNGAAWQPAAGPYAGAVAGWPAWARPFASPALRGLLVTIALGLLGAGYVVEILGDALALAGLKGSSADQVGLADVMLTIGGLIVASTLVAAIVLFCMWTHRMYRNLPALGGVGLKSSPRWAVGWWFIPIANLWKPYQVIREIWQHTMPAGQGAGVLGIWWALWLISNYADNAVFRSNLSGSVADVVDLLSAVLDIAAALLAVLVVQRLTRGQLRRAAGAA